MAVRYGTVWGTMLDAVCCGTTTTTTTSVDGLWTLVRHQQWNAAEQYLRGTASTTTQVQHSALPPPVTPLRQGGRTLLHCLLEEVSILQVVQQPQQQQPHSTVASSVSVAVTRLQSLIDLVASLDPEAIVTADSTETTPLHLACSCLVEPVSCAEIVAILLRRLQDYAPTAMDVTPPQEQQRQEQQQQPRRWFAPWKVMAPNKEGMTAFHLACGNNHVSLETLQLLVQANPAALLICDNEGGHPIVALYREIRSPDHLVRIWKKIEYVVSEYYSLTRSFPKQQGEVVSRRHKKHYVLHGLLEVRRRYSPVRCPCYLALRFCDQDCLLAPDAAGDLPLHVLLRNFPAFDHGIDMVTAMLKLAPTSARVKNRAGDLPLHIAIRNQLRFKNGTKSIVAAYPDAVGQHDAHGLYPFQLVAATTGDLTTTYHYLRHHPHVLLDFGMRPETEES